MTKENIIKALELCGESYAESCCGCPYAGMENCDQKMGADAIALLKANEPPKPKYTQVFIYTKQTNLSDYLAGKIAVSNISLSVNQLRDRHEYYAREREVQLIALFRWEDCRCFCKVKCPINPIPVKGEFEVPSIGAIDGFLKKEGWTFKQKIYPKMFE